MQQEQQRADQMKHQQLSELKGARADRDKLQDEVRSLTAKVNALQLRVDQRNSKEEELQQQFDQLLLVLCNIFMHFLCS